MLIYNLKFAIPAQKRTENYFSNVSTEQEFGSTVLLSDWQTPNTIFDSTHSFSRKLTRVDKINSLVYGRLFSGFERINLKLLIQLMRSMCWLLKSSYVYIDTAFHLG